MSNRNEAEKLIEGTLDGEHSDACGHGYDKEAMFLLAAIGYALLDVADAIREQTRHG